LFSLLEAMCLRHHSGRAQSEKQEGSAEAIILVEG
jgi:hypothetical protein